jgi:hypothetical protein
MTSYISYIITYIDLTYHDWRHANYQQEASCVVDGHIVVIYHSVLLVVFRFSDVITLIPIRRILLLKIVMLFFLFCDVRVFRGTASPTSASCNVIKGLKAECAQIQ